MIFKRETFIQTNLSESLIANAVFLPEVFCMFVKSVYWSANDRRECWMAAWCRRSSRSRLEEEVVLNLLSCVSPLHLNKLLLTGFWLQWRWFSTSADIFRKTVMPFFLLFVWMLEAHCDSSLINKSLCYCPNMFARCSFIYGSLLPHSSAANRSVQY